MKKDRLYTVNPWNKNLFAEAGAMEQAKSIATTASTSAGNYMTENKAKEAIPTNAILNTTNSNSSIGGIDSMLSMGQNLDSSLGNVISGGKSSVVGDALKSVPMLGFVGGAVNALFGAKVNQENVDKYESQNTAYNNATFGSDSSAEVLSNFANTADLEDIEKKSVGKEGIFSNKITDMTADLNEDRRNANAHKQAALIQSAYDLDSNNDNALMANYSKYGGLINRFDVGGPTDNSDTSAFKDWWSDSGKTKMFGVWGNPSATNEARIQRQQGYASGESSQFGGKDNIMAYASAAKNIIGNIRHWKDEDYVKSNLGSNAGMAGQAIFGVANAIADHKRADEPTLEDKIGLAYGGPVHKFALGGSDYAQIASSAANLANNFAVQTNTKNIDGIESQLRRRGNINFTGDSNNSLMSSWTNNYRSYNGSGITDYDLRGRTTGQDVLSGVQAGVEGATTGFNVGGAVGAVIGGIVGTGSSVVGSMIGRNRAREKRSKLVSDIANTNERQVRTFDVMRGNLDRSNDLNAKALDYAFGGPFRNRFDSGGYIPGGTYDLDENEIQNLIDKGYQIEYE